MDGQIVEDFTLLDQYSNKFNLYENLVQKILLVFYPKDDTPVCSRQLFDYDLNHELFQRRNIKVVAVNIGDVNEHKSFCDKKGFKFPILSDKNKIVSRQFDALNLFGQNKRKLVLISEDKRILFENTMPAFTFLDSQRIINTLIERKII